MNLGWSKKTGDSNFFTGAIQYFAMTEAPKGWLKADGSMVSRTKYKNLFSAIGVAFGAGDGSVTFNVPDLRGEFIRGSDEGRGIDLGRKFGTLQTADTKAHTHGTLSYPYRANTSLYTIPTEQDTVNVYSGTTQIGTKLLSGAQATIEFGATLTGGSETRPRNINLLACIKY